VLQSHAILSCDNNNNHYNIQFNDREAGVAYKSRKYELCSLKVECTNVTKEFTGAVLLDVNKFFS